MEFLCFLGFNFQLIIRAALQVMAGIMAEFPSVCESGCTENILREWIFIFVVILFRNIRKILMTMLCVFLSIKNLQTVVVRKRT